MAGEQTIDKYLALAERALPGDYVATLKPPAGNGWEAFAAAAAVMARASRAVSRADDALYTYSAPAGAFATVPVKFYRQNTTAGAFTVKGGTIVSNGKGVRFLVESDVALGAMDTESDFILARAEGPGYEWNVLGEVTAEDGTVIPGEVNTIERLETDPPYADPTLQVKNVDPGSGGLPPVVEQRGADRGFVRQLGEDAEIYQERVRSLPLVVSAPNLEKLLQAIFGPYGIVVELVETFEPQVSGAFDAATVGGMEPYFVLDDERASSAHFRNHWMDCVSARGTFIVLVPKAQPILDYGGPCDEPAVDVVEFLSPLTGGMRGVLAFDVVNAARDPRWMVAGLDGEDIGYRGLVAGAFQSMERQKLGGVVVLFDRKGA